MADYNPNQFVPDAQSRARRNPNQFEAIREQVERNRAFNEAEAVPKPLPVPKEMVDHPVHYGGADDPYEAVKVIEAWALPWHLGDCVKYIARHGKKDPAKTIEDLKKARWYLDRFIAHLEKQ